MNAYERGKERAREKAIDYQHKIMTADDLYYSEIAYYCDKFYKLAKRYGLIKEFRENGII
jgi:hypothetical protein